MSKIVVLDKEIRYQKRNEDYYICITDIARKKNPIEPKDVVKNWMRNKNTVAFLGLWEKLNNPNFKGVEFDTFLQEAGFNAFVLPPQKWIEKTNAIGLVSKSGNNGGTFAHKDIAFEFASWISVEFKLYLIKEFQRLKTSEKEQLGWDIRRNLAKINYVVHTDAIKENLIPTEITKKQAEIIYASEADVLNMALFGITAKDWRDQNKDKKGNIRDYADISQLVCLSNLENLNALFIKEKLSQSERLLKLNKIAIDQMKLFVENKRINNLEIKEQK